jgi:hypothetical protein
VKTSSHGLVIDGFVRSSRYSGSVGYKTPKIKEASNLLNSNLAKDKLKNTAQNVHKGAQRSQTLMRGIVHKPARNAKPKTEANPPKVEKSQTITSKTRTAKSLIKSPAFRTFDRTRAFGKENNKVAENAKSTPVVQEHTARVIESRAVARPLTNLNTANLTNQQLERMLDRALTSASNHKNALKGTYSQANLWQKIKYAPRWMTIGVGSSIVVLAVGYITWHKVPQVAMALTAAKANVSAHVPGYTPTGFKYAGQVKATDAGVSIKFHSSENTAKSYTLTQKKSSMPSKSLAENTLPKNTQVQTSQVDGTTVYIYGDQNDALWINHGIQFSIHDEAGLNSDQVLKIANSL